MEYNGEIIVDFLEILGPIALIFAGMAILIMLPVYFIRKRTNPNNPKNTIKRLVILSLVAATILTLVLSSGLIAIYINDIKINNDAGNPVSQYMTDEDSVKLYSIEITIASPNNSHIYAAKYPYHYYYVDKEAHRCRLIDIPDNPSKIISRKDFDVFADFIIGMDESSPSKGDTFAYSIYVSYYNDIGNTESMFYKGFDSFPEELNAVIDKINELSGMPILSYPDETVNDEVGFLYDEFGYSESDYPRTDVEAMLSAPTVSVAKLLSTTNTFAGFMDGYYTELELEKIQDKIPTGSEVGEEVSMEELKSFAEGFASILGADWKVSESTKSDRLFDVYRGDEHPMPVGRVVDIPLFGPDLENASIFIADGPEGEGYNASYVIDSSGNYFLADYMNEQDFVSIVETFTE